MNKNIENADYQVVSLVNLGCCYHLLTEKGGLDWTDRGTERDTHQQQQVQDDHSLAENPSNKGSAESTIPTTAYTPQNTFGYPMSRYLDNSTLGLNNRMVACQAPKQWQADISSKANAGLGSIRRLYYRSVLERIMKEYNIHPPHLSSYEALKATATGERAIKKMGVKECVDPVTYTHAALKRLGCCVPDQLTNGVIMGTFEWHNAAKEEIAEVWALRCMLGDVVETLILVDRCLRVRESGCSVDLVSICDPGESPRNMAVVCTYDNNLSTLSAKTEKL
ncbi:MAG: hypothetical protein WCI18_15605 [Pseudomonadota bacterium]